MSELDFYNKVKNWDFSMINYTKECLTNWDFTELIKQNIKYNSRVLDLGTGGGEKVIKYFPECAEILGTDYSSEMIKTANEKLYDKWNFCGARYSVRKSYISSATEGNCRH